MYNILKYVFMNFGEIQTWIEIYIAILLVWGGWQFFCHWHTTSVYGWFTDQHSLYSTQSFCIYFSIYMSYILRSFDMKRANACVAKSLCIQSLYLWRVCMKVHLAPGISCIYTSFDCIFWLFRAYTSTEYWFEAVWMLIHWEIGVDMQWLSKSDIFLNTVCQIDVYYTHFKEETHAALSALWGCLLPTKFWAGLICWIKANGDQNINSPWHKMRCTWQHVPYSGNHWNYHKKYSKGLLLWPTVNMY